MKKAEREEVRELEGLDADERRQELMDFLGMFQRFRRVFRNDKLNFRR